MIEQAELVMIGTAEEAEAAEERAKTARRLAAQAKAEARAVRVWATCCSRLYPSGWQNCHACGQPLRFGSFEAATGIQQKAEVTCAA